MLYPLSYEGVAARGRLDEPKAGRCVGEPARCQVTGTVGAPARARGQGRGRAVAARGARPGGRRPCQGVRGLARRVDAEVVAVFEKVPEP
jgi:hypothetical protein